MKIEFIIKNDNISMEIHFKGWFIKPEVCFHEALDRFKEINNLVKG